MWRAGVRPMNLYVAILIRPDQTQPSMKSKPNPIFIKIQTKPNLQKSKPNPSSLKLKSTLTFNQIQTKHRTLKNPNSKFYLHGALFWLIKVHLHDYIQHSCEGALMLTIRNLFCFFFNILPMLVISISIIRVLAVRRVSLNFYLF